MKLFFDGIFWILIFAYTSSTSLAQDGAVCRKPTINGPGSVVPNQLQYKIGIEVEIVCDDGFFLPSGTASRVRCGLGGFVPEVFECVELEVGCPKSNLPTIEGEGSFDKNKETYDFSEVVTVTCGQYYEVKGESQSMCYKTNSTFTPSTINCSRMEEFLGCLNSTLPIIEGKGKINMTKDIYDVGDVIDVICDEGFEIVGNFSSIVCQQNFTFQLSTVKCVEKVGCLNSTLPVIEGKGKINMTKDIYDVGDVIDVICDEGFEIVGDFSSIVCQQNFTFQLSTVKCVEKAKGCLNTTLPVIEGKGKINMTKDIYDVGDVIDVICDEGFEIVGDFTSNTTSIICQENFTFHPSTIKCTEVLTLKVSAISWLLWLILIPATLLIIIIAVIIYQRSKRQNDTGE